MVFMDKFSGNVIVTLCLLLLSVAALAEAAPKIVVVAEKQYVLTAGHPSLAEWILPKSPESPADNPATLAKIKLGQKLFFDRRLSAQQTMACASCHKPEYGWSDGRAKASGFGGKLLPRATPTIINAGYNPVQNWDGRIETLEQQALEPILDPDEMHMSIPALLARIENIKEYRVHFQHAFPATGISAAAVAKAIASFERTIISRNSPFDRWIAGDSNALTAEQIAGFAVFMDPEKADCMACHSPPNFTDSSFHNIGLASYLQPNPDLGRFKKLPLQAMKGAFKTPTLRNVSQTAPYFHDGSAQSLRDVIDHYVRGGISNPHITPEMKPLNLTPDEINALESFLLSLTGRVDFYNPDSK